MKRLHVLAPVMAVPLLVLTWLLVQGATPDLARHERMLDALRSLILDNAALQRDVLRARGGLLRDYDPLVRSLSRLQHAVASLAEAGGVAEDETRPEIIRRVEALAAAVRDQEAKVETFKSRNALLQNSLNYFNHLTAPPGVANDLPGDRLPAETAILGSAMLRFTTEYGSDAAGEMTAALDRLEGILEGRSGESLGAIARAMIVHGRLIVITLPAVDDLVARIQADPTPQRVRAVEEAYLAAYGRAAARAGLFRVLLYVAAVVLAVYVTYLFARLRHNERILKQRLSFESLIASVSTQFINLPRERIRGGVDTGLAQLAAHAGVDRAHVIIVDPDGKGVVRCHDWLRVTDVGRARHTPADLLSLATDLHTGRREDRVHIPRVGALAEGAVKAQLRGMGLRSWLSLAMTHAGRHVGFLVLVTDTAEKRWVEDDIALVRTASEIFANSISRERAEADREALEARLHQSQRLEAVGTLAGGIAHEFNNILGVMLGYGEMALGKLPRPDPAHRYVEQIMRAGTRAQGVVEQVLAFSRRRTRQYRPVRIQSVIAEAVDFVRTSLPATLTVAAHLDAGEATVLTDPTEMQQVLINLCTNAAQAMEERGILSVDLGTLIVVGESLPLSHGNLEPGHYLRLAVRDQGHGIEPAIMERIFEPFFTTKAVGKGTGLGLATVHGIVSQHGGALNVDSQPGAGTLFEAYFPLSEDSAVEEAGATAEAAPRGNGQTILLVDDQQPLVRLCEEMLASIGYEPVGFEGSAAGLAAFRADPQRFDLVLTDEVMPEMTGLELAGALHEIRPDLPVVLMTGYSGSIGSSRLQAAGIREVLRKPLLLSPLALCLARHLGGK